MADTPSAPPLPDGSVDFNAIHAAARQGHDLEKAVAEARTHPAGEKAHATPRAARKTKRAKAAAKPSTPAKAAPAPAAAAAPTETVTAPVPVDNKEA